MHDLNEGFLVVLPRQQAKDFFGYREDQPRLDFLSQLLSSPESMQLSCEGKWQALHDAFCAAKVKDSVLDQCLLGGRPCHQGKDHHVCMVRPDVLRAVALQCAEIAETDFGDNWELAQKVADLYRAAVDVGGAMVFVAQR